MYKKDNKFNLMHRKDNKFDHYLPYPGNSGRYDWDWDRPREIPDSNFPKDKDLEKIRKIIGEFGRPNRNQECVHDRLAREHGEDPDPRRRERFHMIACPCAKCNPVTLNVNFDTPMSPYAMV